MWTLDNKTAVKAILAVTFRTAAAEQTNHLRHLGIYSNRMLTYRQHVETAPKCRLVNPKIMAANLNKQHYLFLLYLSMVLNVNNYGQDPA